ncbi:MAG TPA: alginate lyase family protein [Bryobacteraceae bacterium]|nr:alginate lyase family protein [Bryobacteraceae bacterium]
MLATYWNTIRYLRPAQVYGRLHRRGPRLRPAVGVRARAHKGNCVRSISRLPAQTGKNRFCFLNQEREIRGWNDAEIPKLWLYNLHYFEHPTDALIERWVRENPVGCGNGWEPYPIAIRILNWIKWALSGGRLDVSALASMAVQAEYLSQTIEHHLGANHVFADGVALAAAGMFYDDPLANRWLNKGVDLLRNQIAEQVLEDGGHYERSPMYHALILESLLDLLNISLVYELPLEADRALWRGTSSGMLRWLEMMTHSDGRIAFFNDSVFGVAPEPECLFDYAARLDIQPSEDCGQRESGYVRLESGDQILVFDAAPLGPDHQPGHGHADCLSFELSCGSRRVFVNSGISTYERGAERLWQRGTAAHNTVRVDEQNQSEVWSAFRVARRARPFDLKTDGETFVEAAHDGYQRLPNPVIHRRRVDLGNRQLIITDRIEGSGSHRVELFFHLHPEASPTVVLDEKLERSLIASYWHPEFGRSIPNSTLVGTWKGPCPVEFVTAIHL